MKHIILLALGLSASGAWAETRTVFLEDQQGDRIEIAKLDVAQTGIYQVAMSETAFADHFLSMRPFKCLEGPAKHWCHVPYPYEISRDISETLTDIEYDFLFVWKGSNDYGINMWNGVYYKLQNANGALIGTLHEMDMDSLSAPPPAGELRPVKAKDLHESDPESHWLPRLVVE
jgi:hypothetical protein